MALSGGGGVGVSLGWRAWLQHPEIVCGFGEGWGALATLSLRFPGGARGVAPHPPAIAEHVVGGGVPQEGVCAYFVDDQGGALQRPAWKRQAVQKHSPLASPSLSPLLCLLALSWEETLK